MFAEKKKIILCDLGYFIHNSVYTWNVNKDIPATYTALSMLLGCLKRVDIQPDDIVIVCGEGGNNWRKNVDNSYKANRKDIRDKSGIDWKQKFAEFNKFIERLKRCTPFYFVRIDTLEADDIIAVACRYFKDYTCVIISTDGDFLQLQINDNVRQFSPRKKEYKFTNSPYKVLMDKIKKEKTDNLVTDVITQSDFEKRKLVVDLNSLPDFVEKKVLDKLQRIWYNGTFNYKDYDLNLFPYNSLRERFLNLFDGKSIVNYNKNKKKFFESNKIKKVRRKKKCQDNTLEEVSDHVVQE